MTLRLKAGFAAIVASLLLLVGCGDTFRPVAIPIGKPGGDPATQHTATVVSQNGAGIGTIMQIDTSGDTVMAIRDAGHTPVHAANVIGAQITYIANVADNTVSTVFSGSTEVSNTALPDGSRPVFLLPVGINIYAADSVTTSVSVMAQGLSVVVANIAVGTNPVMLAGTRNKVYSGNQGDSAVHVINTLDKTVA